MLQGSIAKERRSVQVFAAPNRNHWGIMTNLKRIDAASSAHRWGIVLAGGNGTRLRDLVYRKRADYLPKQYLNFIGKRSMLEHTLDRAEKLIPAPKLLTVIAREHLQFPEVSRQIAARPQECIIVQPENKDTGPGILLPLMHLHKRNPAAVVTIFPADHFILEEARLYAACRASVPASSRQMTRAWSF